MKTGRHAGVIGGLREGVTSLPPQEGGPPASANTSSSPRSGTNHSRFTDEKTEAQEVQGICPRSQVQSVGVGPLGAI